MAMSILFIGMKKSQKSKIFKKIKSYWKSTILYSKSNIPKTCGWKKSYETFFWDHFFILWENFQVLTDFDVVLAEKLYFFSFSCGKTDFFWQNLLNQIKNDRSRKINADGPREKRFDCRSSKWPADFAQKCKFGTDFFSTLVFIWKSHSLQFWVYALPNRLWPAPILFFRLLWLRPSGAARLVIPEKQ